MQLRHLSGAIPVVALAVFCTGAIAATPPLPAFTAHYRVLQNGSPIGEATLTLAPGANGTWTFTTESKGTAGLASLLAAGTREVSTFRWVGDAPQGISYDYTMQSALKQKRRSVRFDWSSHTVEVNDNGAFRFATRPGAVERHTVPIALAAGLAAGKTTFTLPVAVRDRIETQHFSAQGNQNVGVPAGSFDATRVSRTDGGDGFEAWFAPAKLPAPVKIDQRGKNDFSLELESWSKS
ncbi:MAG: DUF3108 domain-containing protein [Xanthomonadales bacterium]|nr:DUF3108 domain-containing protein [Xanthomonadales bacterium]ODU93768.1 MAG: hypothetical protein ABT18_07035 [Rhodanobacter sp. SCN 66-43]OJY83268.1 MAG: hypothetical protein BGP23_09600 [Xanthomonadales bacterium 66-474]